MTTKAQVSIEVHPAALLFPMMEQEELNKLADDIAANGLMEPIVIYQGQILDGRNRLAACTLADVEPKFVEAEDVASPTIYVLSRNLHRRHLTVSQRAAIAADTAEMLREEAHYRQIANLKNQHVGSYAPNGVNEPFHANEIAAKELQVGERTVNRAIKVKREDPEAFERVRRGEITVNEASREQESRPSRATPKDKPYEPKTDYQKKLASGQKERMIHGLSVITGVCRGLSEADIRKIVAACDEEERATWVERAKELANQLRVFAGKLQKGF